jgi:hypothetical protein
MPIDFVSNPNHAFRLRLLCEVCHKPVTINNGIAAEEDDPKHGSGLYAAIYCKDCIHALIERGHCNLHFRSLSSLIVSLLEDAGLTEEYMHQEQVNQVESWRMEWHAAKEREESEKWAAEHEKQSGQT